MAYKRYDGVEISWHQAKNAKCKCGSRDIKVRDPDDMHRCQDCEAEWLPKFYKELAEAVEKLGAAASHWDEMKVDQKQSDAKALGWDENAGKLRWDDLTPEQHTAYEKHYAKEN